MTLRRDNKHGRRHEEQDIGYGPSEAPRVSRSPAIGDDPSKSDDANYVDYLREKVLEFIANITAFDRNRAKILEVRAKGALPNWDSRLGRVRSSESVSIP